MGNQKKLDEKQLSEEELKEISGGGRSAANKQAVDKLMRLYVARDHMTNQAALKRATQEADEAQRLGQLNDLIARAIQETKEFTATC